jgi:hypothetical protein
MTIFFGLAQFDVDWVEALVGLIVVVLTALGGAAKWIRDRVSETETSPRPGGAGTAAHPAAETAQLDMGQEGPSKKFSPTAPPFAVPPPVVAAPPRRRVRVRAVAPVSQGVTAAPQPASVSAVPAASAAPMIEAIDARVHPPERRVDYGTIRRAIVWREILSAPLALRDPEQSPP